MKRKLMVRVLLAGVALLGFGLARLGSTSTAQASCTGLYDQAVWCGTPCATSIDYVKYEDTDGTDGETVTKEMVPVCKTCCTQPACSWLGNNYQWNYVLHGTCGGSGPVSWDDNPVSTSWNES